MLVNQYLIQTFVRKTSSINTWEQMWRPTASCYMEIECQLEVSIESLTKKLRKFHRRGEKKL